MPTARQLNVRHGLRVGGKSLADGSGVLTDVGNISTLSTTNKTSIVAAVNEVKGNFTNIDTADVAEDPSYLYFTNARSRQSISVMDSGGDGSLSYDNVSGVLTFTGPSASEVRAHFSGGTGVTITNGTVAIGQPVSTSSSVTFANTTLTGVLYGPSQFVIDPAAQGDNTGEVIILGDLTVQGTTTTINSTTVEIEDKNIILAKSATNSLQADGSGISVAGSNASVLYAALTDSWNLNRTVKGTDGSESSPTYSFTSDPGLGLYRSADNQLSIATNSLERLRVSDTLVTLINSVDFVLNRGTYDGKITTTSLTSNRVYTLPNVSGTLVTTGDTGTVTSTMIADGTIVDIDINAAAKISVSKLADGSARQLLQTDAAGTGVEWTSNVDVPGTLDVTGVATFDTKISIGTAEPTTQQEVGWNADKGTLEIGLRDGVKSPYGQDIITLCRNGTASTIAKGAAVMFSGTIGNSGMLKVAPMVANGTYPGYVFFGVAAQSIAAGADGYVRSFGEIKGVNTNINEGGVNGQWVEGDILWCNPATPGGFTKTEPLAPNLKLPVAAVVSVGNNGILFVRSDTGNRLQDLHDVDANGTTANNELLQYNASASRWEHRSNITIPGVLTVSTGTSSAPSITFNGDTDTGIYSPGPGSLAFTVNAYSWTWPTTDATVPGYVLKSNGSGVMSWGLPVAATGGSTDQVFYENGQVITTSYTLTSGKNAMTAGPVTINSNAMVTIPSGQSWVIV